MVFWWWCFGDFVTFTKILTSSSIIQCCKCHAKMQSDNPMSRSHCYMAICTMLSYELKRMRGATLGNTKRTLRQDQREKCSPRPRPPLGGASLWRFGDALLSFCVLKSIGSSYSLKKHTICANFVRSFLQKWNFQDCQITPNYWVCHG